MDKVRGMDVLRGLGALLDDAQEFASESLTVLWNIVSRMGYSTLQTRKPGLSYVHTYVCERTYVKPDSSKTYGCGCSILSLCSLLLLFRALSWGYLFLF